MTRLRSDVWVSWLIRQVSAAGAFATVLKRGAAEAGAIFLVVDGGDGLSDLYGPAPQSVFDTSRPQDRIFACMGAELPADDVTFRLAGEQRFDADLWIVEIQDRRRRPFVELFDESPDRSHS